MAQTPDRFPGEREDEGILLDEVTTVPQNTGGIRYVSGSFQMRDSIGVFNPRTGADDKTVKVSANDATSAFLDTKIVAGTNITLVELNDGGIESLQISASGSLPIPDCVGQILYAATIAAFTKEIQVVTEDGFTVMTEEGFPVVM